MEKELLEKIFKIVTGTDEKVDKQGQEIKSLRIQVNELSKRVEIQGQQIGELSKRVEIQGQQIGKLNRRVELHGKEIKKILNEIGEINSNIRYLWEDFKNLEERLEITQKVNCLKAR